MKRLFSIIFLSLIATAALAQNTVTGSVKDAATGEPLIGVGVLVSTGGGAVTDMDGSYSVKAGADATITFNMLGYSDVVEAVNGRNKIDVFMKEDVHFLDDPDVLDAVLDERRLELYYEGFRITDLLRNERDIDRRFPSRTVCEIIPYTNPKIQYQIPTTETSISGIPGNDR